MVVVAGRECNYEGNRAKAAAEAPRQARHEKFSDTYITKTRRCITQREGERAKGKLKRRKKSG